MGADYVVVFEDDFEEEGNTNWWIVWGTWTLAQEDGNGYLRAADGRVELVKPAVYSTYSLRADVWLWEGETVLMYRESYEHGYHLHLMLGVLSLFRFDGESEEQLINKPAPISSEVWHTVEISGTRGTSRFLWTTSCSLTTMIPIPGTLAASA